MKKNHGGSMKNFINDEKTTTNPITNPKKEDKVVPPPGGFTKDIAAKISNWSFVIALIFGLIAAVLLTVGFLTLFNVSAFAALPFLAIPFLVTGGIFAAAAIASLGIAVGIIIFYKIQDKGRKTQQTITNEESQIKNEQELIIALNKLPENLKPTFEKIIEKIKQGKPIRFRPGWFQESLEGGLKAQRIKPIALEYYDDLNSKTAKSIISDKEISSDKKEDESEKKITTEIVNTLEKKKGFEKLDDMKRHNPLFAELLRLEVAPRIESGKNKQEIIKLENLDLNRIEAKHDDGKTTFTLKN